MQGRRWSVVVFVAMIVSFLMGRVTAPVPYLDVPFVGLTSGWMDKLPGWSGSEEELAPLDEVLLARVGDRAIYGDTFATAASHAVRRGDTGFDFDDRLALLDELIERELLWQEAMRDGAYEHPRVREVLRNTLLRPRVYDQIQAGTMGEEELRAYYEAHREDFDLQERVQVSRLFLAIHETRTEERAREEMGRYRYQLLANPSRFAELASAHSEDIYRRRGGDMGYLSADGKKGVSAEILDAALKLDAGQFSEVFLAEGGVNLLYAVNRRASVERPFSQIQGAVLRKLKQERYNEATRSYVQALREEAEITIERGALANLDLTAQVGSVGEAVEMNEGSITKSVSHEACVGRSLVWPCWLRTRADCRSGRCGGER